jgi:hypothetical protein
MWSRQLSTFAGSFSCQRGASVVSAMREGFALSEKFPPSAQTGVCECRCRSRESLKASTSRPHRSDSQMTYYASVVIRDAC